MDGSETNLPLRQAYVQSARLARRYSIGAMSARDREGSPRSCLPLVFCRGRGIMCGTRHFDLGIRAILTGAGARRPAIATVVRDQLSSRARGTSESWKIV
jgi:hypothetical protein